MRCFRSDLHHQKNRNGTGHSGFLIVGRFENILGNRLQLSINFFKFPQLFLRR